MKLNKKKNNAYLLRKNLAKIVLQNFKKNAIKRE